MSLSRIYKDQGDFIPERLVPRPPRETDNWKPVTISEDQVKELDLAIHAQQDNSTDNSGISVDATDGNNTDKAAPENTPEIIADPTLDPDPKSKKPPPSPPMPDLKKLQEEAFQAGILEGIKQAETDFGTGAKALTLACELLNNIRDTILKNSKGEMIDLVITLSEKIIRHSITEQDQTIVNTVEDAILQAVKSTEFYIYLHPEDTTIINEKSQDLISRVNGLDNIVVKTDPGIEQGGCKIESDNCTVDATLASQLEIIHKHIREEK